MRNLPFPDGSPQLRSLGVLVMRYADATRQIRKVEAERLRLLTEMERLAHEESLRLGRRPSRSDGAPGDDAVGDGDVGDNAVGDNAVGESAVGDRPPGGGALGDVDSVSGAAAEMSYRTVAAEVGFAVRIADREVMRDLELAMRLDSDYPVLHEQMSAGRIGIPHARAVVDAGGIIAEGRDRAAYGVEMAEIAVEETPNRVRRLARVVAAKYVPEREERERVAQRLRARVEVVDLDDGLAELRAVMEAVHAHAIKDRLTRQARSIQRRELSSAREAEVQAAGASLRGSGERALAGVRPLDQIRVSILTDELLHAAPSNETGDVDLSGVSARIQITVPILGLLPEEQRPEHRTGIAGLQGAAMLAGCGPIDTDTARFLASIQPTWDRVSCHPETGEVLTVDAYRPSEGLRRRVFARDQHCRYPGCLVVPHRADIDHAVDAALGGATATDNLQVLCRYHHTIKHNTGVEARMLADGEIRWVSPLGTVVTDRPRSRVAFRPVPPHDEDTSPPGGGRVGWCPREGRAREGCAREAGAFVR